MHLLTFLAQTPILTPSATATAVATVTPTGTPSQALTEPFWSSGSGIVVIILMAIVAGVIAGLITKKGGIGSVIEKLFADFTNVLAYVVVILAFIGIFLLAYLVVHADHAPETAKYVFGAILPLLGTWVGTVLAHYFQKENLAAATQSISDLALKVGGADKLKSTPVKTVMIRPDRIDTLPDTLLDKPDDQIKLAELLKHLQQGIKRDRLPVFKDNKKTGPAERVIHRSAVERFITQETLAPAKTPPMVVADLTLANLMTDPVFGPLVRGSFGLVKGDATLADAKTAMDKKTAELGTAGSCYDVFVTENGSPSESVIGWITNDIINDNAKV
jgi:hypothetical protein